MYLNSRHLAWGDGGYQGGLRSPVCKKLHFREGDFYRELLADSR